MAAPPIALPPAVASDVIAGAAGSGGGASVRWVGVGFLGAAALCFAGFAAASLRTEGDSRRSLRLVLVILAAILFLVGVVLAIVGVAVD
jgi:hypothetical protein